MVPLKQVSEAVKVLTAAAGVAQADVDANLAATGGESGVSTDAESMASDEEWGNWGEEDEEQEENLGDLLGACQEAETEPADLDLLDFPSYPTVFLICSYFCDFLWILHQLHMK